MNDWSIFNASSSFRNFALGNIHVDADHAGDIVMLIEDCALDDRNIVCGAVREL